MTFPFKIVFATLTHRSVLRNRRRGGTDKKGFIHVAIISTLMIFAANIFLTGVLLAAVVIGVVMAQVISYQFIGIPLFFTVVKRKTMHNLDSPLSGQYVTIKYNAGDGLGNKEILIENWVDRMPGRKSWLDYQFNNQAVTFYAIRKGQEYDERDADVDEVLYGHIDGIGFCVHLTELDLATVRPGPAGYRARVWDVEP